MGRSRSLSLVVLSLLACGKVVVSADSTVRLVLALDGQVPDYPAGVLTVTVDERSGEGSLFIGAAAAEPGRTDDGIDYSKEIRDSDQDGRYELVFQTTGNPFLLKGNPWNLYITGTLEGRAFRVIAEILNGGTAKARAIATLDSNSDEIRFGPYARTVTLTLACVEPLCAGIDAGADAGFDAGDAGAEDAGADASADAGADASADAGADAGLGGTCAAHNECGAGRYCGAPPAPDAGVAAGVSGCPDGELGSATGDGVAIGTTVDAGNRYSGSCGSGAAPDRAFGFTAPVTGTYIITTRDAGFDTVLYIRDGGCGGSEIVCNDEYYGSQSRVSVALTAGQTVGIVVDGYYTSSQGPYYLNIAPPDGGASLDAGPTDAGPPRCQDCSASDPAHCGDGTSDAGCVVCSGATPLCVSGVCRCGTHATCGTGKYCSSMGAGDCLSCALNDPMFCGNASADAGCAVCSGATPACVAGFCRCTSHSTCGTGKYCTDLDGGTCQPCSETDPLHCGLSGTDPGCRVCSGTTPACVSGACVCTSNGSCDAGNYCTNLTGGICGACGLSDPAHCGTPTSAAGCAECLGGTFTCASGACVCTGFASTDTCIAYDGRICDGGVCTACLDTTHCAPGGCCTSAARRCIPPTLTWTVLPAPSARYHHKALYDSVNLQMIMTGGYDNYGQISEVWALRLPDGGLPEWRALPPAGAAPAARNHHAIAHDSNNQRLVLFGGWDGAQNRNDVWLLALTSGNTASWTQLSPSGTPPAVRRGHSAVFDSVGQQLIVFGGYGSSYMNDVWALSLPDAGPFVWTQLSPVGPPAARAWHSAVFHLFVDGGVEPRMTIFGGESSAGAYYNDTWSLALPPLGTPTWIAHTPSVRPSARRHHSAVYDSANKRMVVFGGKPTGTLLRDVWQLPLALQTAEWAELDAGPTWRRYGHSAVYDVEKQRMMIFSGFAISNDFFPYDVSPADLWWVTLPDAGQPVWTELKPLGDIPTPRWNPTMVRDTANDRFVLFGGSEYPIGSRDDVWELRVPKDGGLPRWTEIRPDAGPALRNQHSAVFDSANQRLVIFGGRLSGSSLNDTWALTLVDGGNPAWVEIDAGGTKPEKRYDHTAIYDSTYERMVIFGGSASSSYMQDVHLLSLSPGGASQWTAATIGSSPVGRNAHSAIFDRANQRMVVFGGAISGSSSTNDTWALSLPAGSAFTWTQIDAGTAPARRHAHIALYDEKSQRMIVSGGITRGGNDTYLSDTWVLSLGANGPYAWSQTSPLGGLPRARGKQGGAIEGGGQPRVVMFGGAAGDNGSPWDRRNDLWTLVPESCE